MSFFPLTHLSNKAQIGVDEPAPFKLLNPKFVDEAVRMLSDHGPDAVILAGGCDILEKIKTQWLRPKYVVNLKSIGAMWRSGRDHEMETGALDPRKTLTEISSYQHYPTAYIPKALAQAAASVASPQIRNMGTIGGNILQDSRCPYYRGPWNCYRAGGNTCDAVRGYTYEHALWGGERCFTVSPSDCAVALVAINGLISITGKNGTRTVEAEELFSSPNYDITRMHKLAPNEIVTCVSYFNSVAATYHNKLRSFFPQSRTTQCLGFRTRQLCNRHPYGR